MSSSNNLDEKQQFAVQLLLSAPISFITGGPGTGKTTCLATAVQRLEALGRSYVLCAPTGKAARRLSEATNRSAYTIHRLLGYKKDEDNDLDSLQEITSSVVIVDESSMIDLQLMYNLLSKIDLNVTSIAFIGDADQLPPVGQGCPFQDLVKLVEHVKQGTRAPFVRFQKVYRQGEGSWVANNAPRVLHGEGLDLETKPDFEFYLMDTKDGPHIPGVVVDVMKEIDDFDNTQILTPTKQTRSVGSTIELNRVLQKAIVSMKSKSWKLVNDEQVFVGSRVMQTKNDYSIDRFNGEVGKVIRITSDNLVVAYDNGATEYDGETAVNLQLAYATTIHKSQGSEFDYVILVLHSRQPKTLLTRQLLYTAITRARKGLYIIGDELGLGYACANTHDTRRCTLLNSKLAEKVTWLYD